LLPFDQSKISEGHYVLEQLNPEVEISHFSANAAAGNKITYFTKLPQLQSYKLK
jgi:hypothetical protein